MVKLLLFLQTLAALCTSTSSAAWMDKEEQQTDVALLDNNHRRPNLRELARKPITIGECQGTCGINRRCAKGLKCARYNQDALKSIGHDPNFAYCDSSEVPAQNKKNMYFCYDPYLASMPPCDANNFLSSCDPNTYKDCLQVPVRPSEDCGPVILGAYNETMNICAKYNFCSGYTYCTCNDCGTNGTPDFTAVCIGGFMASNCAIYQ